MANGRPTILQIIPRLDTGGAELSAIEITEAIVRAGGRALVATEGGRIAERVTTAGGELIEFPAATKNPLRIVANARRLETLIAHEKVDLLHARSRAPAWSALIATHRAKIPFVTTYHGAYGEKGRIKNLYNSVMARADIVIANSGYTARLIRERYGTPDERIRIIHRGVDAGVFSAETVGPARVHRLLSAWGVDAKTPVVLHAARLTGWKGQSVLIDAVALLRDRGGLGNAMVVLAGDAQGRDDYRSRLERQIAAHGLDGRVRLVGHVDDIAAAYLAAHVTVVPSTEPEAFGRAAIEAQAMGCPVISTDIGAPPETVRAAPLAAIGSETGWLMPPSDPHALAVHLVTALALSGTAQQEMSQRARLHIEANFTLEAMKRSTLAVYDQLLGVAMTEQFAKGTPSTSR